MYTESTLEILENYFRFYENQIKCSPFSWDKKTGRLSPTKNKWQLYHQICQWVFGIVVIVYMTGRLLQELFVPDPKFKTYQMIMYIFYYLIVLVALSINFTLITQTRKVTYTINVMTYFNLSFRDKLCPFEKGKHPPVPLGEKILKYMIPATFFISICGACLSLMSPLDPLQRFVIDYIPQIYDDYTWYVKIGAFCGVVVCGSTIWGPIALVTALGLMYLDGGIFWLTTLNGKNMEEASKKAREILRGNPKLQMNLFRGLGLVNFMVNYYPARIAFPACLAVGALIGIVTNYATIKLYDRIPMPGFLMMPLVSVFVYFATAAIIGSASRFHEESGEFISMIVNHQSKEIRAEGRALRPLAMQCWDVGSIRRGITLSYFGFITDMSISMIMS